MLRRTFAHIISTIFLFQDSGFIIKPKDKMEPEFFNVPVLRQLIDEKSAYADIINRSSKPYLSSSRTTNGHESTHDLNNDLSGTTKWTKDGFYVMEGRGIILDRPKISRLQINSFVPASLRFTRYHMYLAHTKYGGDSPLYLMDEWVAYTNGAVVLLEDVENGKFENDRSDGVESCLEFSIYTIALCIAIEKLDNEYWKTNDKFKTFVKWQLKRAETLFLKGLTKKECKFKRQEDMLHNLKISADAQPIRDFINTHFDGVFIK